MSRLVELTKVYSRARADVIVSMLKAYGIHAQAPLYNVPRAGWIPIQVPETELEAARVLITDIMAEDDPDFAPPGSERGPSPDAVHPNGETFRSILATLVSILIVTLAGHLAGLWWLRTGGTPLGMEDRIQQAAMMLSTATAIGVIIARAACDFIFRRYSDTTVFIGLALFGGLPIALFAFTDAPLSTRALQAAPSLALIGTAFLMFWPHKAKR